MFEIYVKLLLFALIPVAFSIGFHFLLKTKIAKKVPFIWQQIIIGVIFGGIAILGTEFGVSINNTAAANARDAAPLCAGLIFGGPAGIIAGLIGGLERVLTTVIFHRFEYSMVACSVSTALAGIYAALLRKFLFENKRPSWGFGLASGLIMEVIHLTILLMTKMDNTTYAIYILKLVALPMIIANSISVGLACLVLDLITYDKNIKARYGKLSTKIQIALLFVCAAAFIGTTAFIDISQNGSSNINADNLMSESISDIKYSIDNADDFTGTVEDQLMEITTYRHVGKTGFIIIMKEDGSFIHKFDTVQIKDLYDGVAEYNFSTVNISLDELSNLQEGVHYQKEIFKTDCYYMYAKNGGYYIIAALPTYEVFETRDAQIFINSFLEVIVFALLFAAIYFLIKLLVVNNIIKINNTLDSITNGDLNQKVEIKTSDEFISLSSDINYTVDSLKNLIAEAEARIDSELAFAKTIQLSALPSTFPAFPGINQFDIYATMNTAKEVGGDFYDMYMIDKDHLCFLIADVSGKGIPAAMFMMESKTMLKNFATANYSVDEILIKANDNLCQGNDANMFVTCWIGILDINTGLIKFGNAGHNYPIVYRKDKGWELLPQRKNLVLGGMSDIPYFLQEVQLNPGDRIYLYTDGVTEATRRDGKLYGEDRLLAYLNSTDNAPKEDLLDGIQKDIDKFIDGADQFDDITMLVVDYFGNQKNNS